MLPSIAHTVVPFLELMVLFFPYQGPDFSIEISKGIHLIIIAALLPLKLNPEVMFSSLS